METKLSGVWVRVTSNLIKQKIFLIIKSIDDNIVNIKYSILKELFKDNQQIYKKRRLNQKPLSQNSYFRFSFHFYEISKINLRNK